MGWEKRRVSSLRRSGPQRLYKLWHRPKCICFDVEDGKECYPIEEYNRTALGCDVRLEGPQSLIGTIVKLQQDRSVMLKTPIVELAVEKRGNVLKGEEYREHVIRGREYGREFFELEQKVGPRVGIYTGKLCEIINSLAVSQIIEYHNIYTEVELGTVLLIHLARFAENLHCPDLGVVQHWLCQINM